MAKLKELNMALIGDGNSPHNELDTWLCNKDFPTQDNFDEFKVDGKFPPDGYLGRLSIHCNSYENPWVASALGFVAYLSQNEEAFNKYRDVKVEGARMNHEGAEKKEENTSTESSDAKPISPFFRYKLHRGKVVAELMEESKKWREAGNFKVPHETN